MVVCIAMNHLPDKSPPFMHGMVTMLFLLLYRDGRYD
jgi:hypothetical protein